MDLPAFQLPAFLEALRRGWLDVPHPFTARRERVALHGPEVAGIVFWTRQPSALLPHMDELRRIYGDRLRLQVSLTGLPRELEPRAPREEEVVDSLRRLSLILGPERLTWRMDPLLFSTLSPPAWWLETFARLSARLEGRVREVSLSWLDLYSRARRNLLVLESLGVRLKPPEREQRWELLDGLAELAARHGLPLSACCEPEMLEHPALRQAACLDGAWFEAQNGLLPGALGSQPTREGCGCCRSRDVGVYNSCAFGCRYCYANAKPRDSAPLDPWQSAAPAP